jgi:transcriptional regulator with XRE-family HTH domain
LRLSKYLEKHGISSAQFAIRAHVSNSLIRKILTTTKDISLSVAIRIVKATDSDVDYEELLPEGVLQAKTNFIRSMGRTYRREGLNAEARHVEPEKKNNKQAKAKNKKS